MPFNSFLYACGEALRNLYRNKWMTIASVGVVVVTLLMLGGFMMINFNLNHITEDIKKQVEIVLYIDEEAAAKKHDELNGKLMAHSSLAEVRFVPRSEAMERLKEQLGDIVDGYEGAEDNPLRDSYELRTHRPEAVGKVAKELKNYPAVAEVHYGESTVEKLFTATRAIQVVGLILMFGLAVTAIFLIAHTIRLTVFVRRREIMIMKYVGATNWFIRWPFVLEGMLIGALGAALPLAALYFIYQASLEWVASNNLMFLTLLPLPFVMTELVKYLVPLGTGLGILGSAFSMDRFLRV
ncbi:MAG: ABC transporter permease [Firmicutes bacterium]|nr:ABC transporter permease [Bacillota bacterium]